MTDSSASRPPAPLSRAAVLALDDAGRITAANDAAHALWRAAPGALDGEPLVTLFVFDVVSRDPDLLDAQWEAVRLSAQSAPLILTTRPRDASAGAEIELQLEPGLTAPGAGFLALVSPRSVPAAAASSPAAAGWGWLAEHSATGFFDLHFAAGTIHLSPAWKRLLGYVDAELPNHYDSWLTRLHPDDTAAAPDRLGRKREPGPRPFGVDCRLRHRLGHYVWIHVSGVQEIAADGAVARVAGVCLDITERKEIEETSVANDERLRALSDGGPLGAFEIDFVAGRFWASETFATLLGHTDSTALGDPAAWSAILPPDEAELGLQNWFLARGTTGQDAFVETVRLLRADGRPVPLLLGALRHLNRKRELLRIVGFCCALPAGAATADSTEAAPPALLADALAVLAEGVMVTDPRGRLVYLNPTASRLLRLTPAQALGQAVNDVFHLVHRQTGRPGDDVCDATLAADAPLPLCADHALSTGEPDATPLPIVWTARAVHGPAGEVRGVILVFRDPDEMSLTPEELVKANRFETLGLLAGGIAHDFNNLLTTILGGVSMARDSRDLSKLDDSEKACLAAKALTKQLLTVARGGAGAQTVVPAAEILQDSARIASAGHDSVVTISVPDGTEPVLVDRAQLLQVFQNLIVNAVQAMPPPPHRGRVQASAANVTLAEDQVDGLPGGDYVQFEVRDNGAGIKPENLQRIFDPFFTTKKHGTGLGLATVLSIVRKHGGQIGVESTPGVGTVFTLFLPKAGRPAEIQARRAPSLRFGTGRVLFMDDDPKISALTGTMLQSLDYKYDLARNGEEAVALYKRYMNIGRPYDLVIMDVTVIGGMGAEETFQVLRGLDPDVRAIVASGYDNDDIARRFLDLGFCGYLTKPYRVTDLGKVVKTVLG